MRKLIPAVLMVALACSALSIQAGERYVDEAMKAPTRQADTAIDSVRHGAEITSFAGIKPGQTVVDFIPGEGYWTRIFSGVVGAKGKVLDVWPAPLVAPGAKAENAMKALVAEKGSGKVEAVPIDLKAFSLPTPVDVFFTSQNLHDLPTPFLGGVDITAFSKQVYKALKPGGRFVVVDHAGAAGTGITQVDTLHRIEPAAAKQAVLAAGFVYKGESKVLANPEDNHQLKVFDPAIKGHTDKFAYVFEKPAH
ncbi:class I SAM-dependent methyltransferase [Pseudomonas sp. NPDC090202]|uniref:class I SAM-dependent methyltransferase n=1 Tax=unclassified Pseudomonas TaxID=196821 RepID=UPI00380A082C